MHGLKYDLKQKQKIINMLKKNKLKIKFFIYYLNLSLSITHLSFCLNKFYY